MEGETAKCRDCDWMIIHPNKSMGCLQANYNISIETEKIKAALSSGECEDFRREK